MTSARRISVTSANKDFDKYFYPHKCSLDITLHKYSITCGWFKQFVFGLTTVNMCDVRACSMFKSYDSLCAERYRQVYEYPISIHPFSKLSFWMQLFVAIDIFLMTILLPIWLSAAQSMLGGLGEPRARGERSTVHLMGQRTTFTALTPSGHTLIPTGQSITTDKKDDIYKVIQYCNVLYVMVNVPANLLTGYISGKNKQHIVLDNWKIIKKYLFLWVIIDLLVISSFIFDFLFKDSTKCYIVHLLMVSQLLVLFRYEPDICIVLRMGVASKTGLELLLYLVTYLAANMSFQFTVEYSIEGSTSPASPRNCSWLTITNLWNASSDLKFICSFTRAVGMLRKDCNMHHLFEDGCFEIFFISAWLIAQGFIVHCSFKYMLAVFGSESAKAKYYMMSQQVSTYVNQRRFPPRIKEKILKFYAIRFQSHFFVESTMMDCVCGQLREDIIVRMGRELAREITFLKLLPRAVLIQVCQKFQLAIFIEGDIIYKVNTEGNHMFLVHKGTLASYTESGCEYQHFEDGDYFGEVCLLTRHRRRVTTVVAVSNCELFSLSKENFDLIKAYSTVYDDMKKTAISRLHRIKMVDSQFKANMTSFKEPTK